MTTTTPKHHLSQVDKEHRTAFCSVCGPTRIYVQKPDKAGRVRLYCVQKRRALDNQYQRQRREQKGLQNPNWKPRHLLTEVDAENMTAICSICGPTDIRKRIARQKYTLYICNTKKRAYAHEYKRSHYTPKRSTPRHSLSEVDDEQKTALCLQCGRVRIFARRWQGRIYWRCGKAYEDYVMKLHLKNREFIDAYTVERGCQNCGYNADPLKLELHRRTLNEKDDKISRLVRLGRECLLRELEKSDVFCIFCRAQLRSEPAF